MIELGRRCRLQGDRRTPSPMRAKGGPPHRPFQDRGLDLKGAGPEEQEMIEIWLQTFALIALAYAVTTMVFRPRHLEKQFTLLRAEMAVEQRGPVAHPARVG